MENPTNQYVGLKQSIIAETTVDNSVSRSAAYGERSFVEVVAEAGKPVIDADLNLARELAQYEAQRFIRWACPSGWLHGQGRLNVYNDYTTVSAPMGFVDSINTFHGDGTMLNSFILPKLEALVAGNVVTVEYTNTETSNYNLVSLSTPTIYDGTNATVKRTDFVFLEVWKALVAPSIPARASIYVASNGDITVGDIINVNGVPLTFAGAPGVDLVLVGVDAATTAGNVANAINNPLNSFASFVTARSSGEYVYITAKTPGTSGNAYTFSVTLTIAGALIPSGANFTGGVDVTNKPSQGQLYRHGNVLAPSAVSLSEDMLDSTFTSESSQRVQLQYRLRATNATEGVNFKTQPDGFSNGSVYAQGVRSLPVYAGNPNGDTQTYPFVPADKTTISNNSSAVAYGVLDNGLWIAGDGSATAAADLGAVDGFVYAIPLCFVFRHNDVSNVAAATQGFDPVNNTNGAPCYDHAGYSGVIGVIPSGLSDRPDGGFADVVRSHQVLDLRRHVTPQGIDFTSELVFQTQSLLDGDFKTWAIDTASKQILGDASGEVSSTHLVCNEVGRLQASGGNPPSSGDTLRGEVIRNFDHIARRFSDQSVVERVLVSFYPGDRPDLVTQGGPVAPGIANLGKYVTKVESMGSPKDASQWYEGDVLHLDLSQWDVSTLGGIFQGLDGDGTSAVGLPSAKFSDLAPANTVITDILGAWYDDGHYTNAVSQDVQFATIVGLGTNHVELALDANDLTVNGGDSGNPDYRFVGADVGGVVTPTGSPRRIFVEVEITYPNAVGLTDTFFESVTPDATVYDGTFAGPGACIEDDTTQRPHDMEVLLAPQFQTGTREVHLEYVANDTISHGGAPASGSPIGSVNTETLVSRNQTQLYFPRRVYSAASGSLSQQTAVTDVVSSTVMTVDHASCEYGSSSREVVLTSNLSGSGQTLCNVEYFAQDPIPNYGASGGGYQIGVYYRSHAPQTAGVREGDVTTGVVPTTLVVEPLAYAPYVWTTPLGSGSSGLGTPYYAPGHLIPINDGSLYAGGVAGVTKEGQLTASAEVSVDGFNADTGLLALHPYLPADTQQTVSLGGATNATKPRKDAEFRVYYPVTDDTVYQPIALAQPLSGASRHKVFTSALCRVTADYTPLYRSGDLVLVVFSRYASLDDSNNMQFDATNMTCGAVYRTKGLLSVVGDRYAA